MKPEDERRHRPGRARLWGESWYFDFSTADASLGGFVRLGLYPNLGVLWYWAALVGQGRRLVLVRDHDLELPGGRDLEVRGQGIWSAVNCETPLDHWSIGLEAFAVALDDPAEAYRGERGDLVGLGFDLEWEATAPAFVTSRPADGGNSGGYGQACQVSGEILVGDEQLVFDGAGHRGHAWGGQDWWGAPRCLVAGNLTDGASFWVRTGGGEPAAGYLAAGAGQAPDAARRDRVGVAATFDPAGWPIAASVEVGEELALALGVVAQAPILLETPDGHPAPAHLARALCLYRSRDGRAGGGWAEWLTNAGAGGATDIGSGRQHQRR